MKHCYACGDQPRSAFNKRKRSKDGLDDLCRACKSTESKRSYRKNPDSAKRKAAEWYANNKARHAVRAAEYYKRTQPLKSVAPCKCGCGEMANPGRGFINGHVNKGRVFDEVFCSNMSVAKRNITHETRCKMSESAKKRADRLELRAIIAAMNRERTGDKHPNWRGGTSLEPYGREWKRAIKAKVIKRDGGKCQNPGCLEKSKRLNVHHIDYDKNNSKLNNLITLCTPCHCATNFNREKWQAFYESVLIGDMSYLEVASNVR